MLSTVYNIEGNVLMQRTQPDSAIISYEKAYKERLQGKEPDYLPDKDSLHIIYDDPAVVNENKQKWLSRFDDIFRATLTEGGKGAAE